MRAIKGLAFASRCGEAIKLADLIADFRQTIALFGFTASACGGWVGVGKQRTSRFYFVDWPQDWIDQYTANNYFAQDFVVAEARIRLEPFTWEEVRSSRRLTAAETHVYESARRYGWREVFAVPIYGPFGYQALVTMAAKELCSLSSADRGALQLMALAMHGRCRTTMDTDGFDRSFPPLTAREVECLQWAAAGKTDSEIARIIGISAPTAHFHIEKAKKKFGVRSRIEVIARLVLRGDI